MDLSGSGAEECGDGMERAERVGEGEEKGREKERDGIKFLGGIIQVPNNPSLARDNILAKLETLLTHVDQTLVTRKQKLKLHRLGICPRLSWDPTIAEFPVSWLEKTLDPLVTRFLKRWSGLARSVDPA